MGAGGASRSWAPRLNRQPLARREASPGDRMIDLRMRGWLLRHQIRVFLHRIRFPGRPMFSRKAAENLIGRRIIVGITHEDYVHRPVGQDQYHGRIIRANLQEGIVIQTPSGEEIRLPADLRSVVGARRGEYRFRSTGETVADPDLQTSWTQTLAP